MAGERTGKAAFGRSKLRDGMIWAIAGPERSEVSREIEALPRPDPSIHWVGLEDEGNRGTKQQRLLEHFGLQPSSDLLEIGCGVGRLAYELAGYLDGGSYAGFDIGTEAILWLNEHYAPHLKNFRFDLFDVANARYRPAGSVAAHELRFPYDDDAFDLVCAFEIFMHMQLPEVVNYLIEVARVLRPTGTAVLTFMAINERDAAPRFSGRDFVPIADGVYTRFPERSGFSLAYDDALIRRILEDAGLSVIEEIEGRWHRPLQPAGPGPEHNADVFVVRTAP